MNKKNESIKLRVSKEDKEKLLQLSKARHETLSSYLLHSSLQPHSGFETSIPQIIDTFNLFNEIYHEIQKYPDNQLKEKIMIIYKNNFTKGDLL